VDRLLIIEGSETLRYVLSRQFRDIGFELCEAADYATGLESLLVQPGAGQGFRAVVLGWPFRTDPSADELLAVLNEPAQRDTAVLLMAQQAQPAMRKWAAGRPNSALALWENYGEGVDALARLLCPPQGASSATMQPLREPEAIRVLFVDDSPTARATYRRLLQRNHYDVTTASDIDEGFDLACQSTFDIAIIDYFMPGGNGDELCRRLRGARETAGVAPAILTGTYLDSVIKDSLHAGAVECMFKNEADELFLARISALSRTVRFQKSIDAERKRLEGILSSVGDGVYGVDTQGKISFINAAAKRILGYNENASLEGRSPFELFHYARGDGTPLSAADCVLQQVYGAGESLFSWETTFWKLNGRPAPVACTVYPLHIQGKQEGSVIAFRDISERRRLEDQLRWQSTHDPLTELRNRRYFEEQLMLEVHRRKRSKELSALLYIDLDRFKYVNDTAGHTAGDDVLIEVSRLLRSRLRDTDLLARLGGDEFGIIMRNVTENELKRTSESFRAVLEDYTYRHNTVEYKVHASIGVALIDENSQSPGEVLANADIACHAAKNRGRNRTHVYRAEIDERTVMDHDLGWSARLRDALANDNLLLHFQPILPLRDIDIDALPCADEPLWHQLEASAPGQLYYEVLVRMVGPDRELVAPGAFLPTAERFNLMCEIDFWVISRAIQTLSRLDVPEEVTFSINISGQTLGEKALLDLIHDELRSSRIDPRRLIFEITETAAISNLHSARRLIDELSGIGCRFALDDFGSGFSSFYHLKHLPVDYIKIDGSFVQGMANDAIDRAMVQSMTDIAHSLGRVTIAEYVESREVLRLLKHIGVDYVQGFYISRPLDALTPMRDAVSA
jgi:diguanylate cyclase (GGDEF)-like protein/PAS domain S-box-containing protein